jgi:tRNA (guanine37-N1)-methyltransferase
MLKEALKDTLPQKELSMLSSAFDLIGDIAIIKIPETLVHREGLIGRELIRRMKRIRTVLKQTTDVQGEYRTRGLSLIAGEEKYETLYKENGCLFKVNVRTAYFSPRLSTERERLAEIVSPEESIFNMFAGVGTFSIIIAKKKSCTIESVDKNPEAIRLANESLALNGKLKGVVIPRLSDAKEFAKRRVSVFDRILMPLPERSDEFLDCAFSSAKKGATIHYYVHVPMEKFKVHDWIACHLEDLSLTRQYTIKNWKKVREIGPRYIQAVADILVTS